MSLGDLFGHYFHQEYVFGRFVCALFSPGICPWEICLCTIFTRNMFLLTTDCNLKASCDLTDLAFATPFWNIVQNIADNVRHIAM